MWPTAGYANKAHKNILATESLFMIYDVATKHMPMGEKRHKPQEKRHTHAK